MPHTFQNVKTSLTLQHPSAIHKVQLANRAHKRGFFFYKVTFHRQLSARKLERLILNTAEF
jgi:hypothetical protein